VLERFATNRDVPTDITVYFKKRGVKLKKNTFGGYRSTAKSMGRILSITQGPFRALVKPKHQSQKREDLAWANEPTVILTESDLLVAAPFSAGPVKDEEPPFVPNVDPN
jgi:hypothetical protein